MARATRDSRLESRSARVRLPAGKRYWRDIRKGLALGYYRYKGSAGGSWLVRILTDGRCAVQAKDVCLTYAEAGLEVTDPREHAWAVHNNESSAIRSRWQQSLVHASASAKTRSHWAIISFTVPNAAPPGAARAEITASGSRALSKATWAISTR